MSTRPTRYLTARDQRRVRRAADRAGTDASPGSAELLGTVQIAAAMVAACPYRPQVAQAGSASKLAKACPMEWRRQAPLEVSGQFSHPVEAVQSFSLEQAGGPRTGRGRAEPTPRRAGFPMARGGGISCAMGTARLVCPLRKFWATRVGFRTAGDRSSATLASRSKFADQGTLRPYRSQHLVVDGKEGPNGDLLACS